MKTTQLSAETLKKVLTYSKAAAGLLIIGERVNAQIVYTDVDPDVTISDFEYYPIDFDEADDYELRLYASYYNGLAYVGFTNFQNSFQFVGWTYYSLYARPLAANVLINDTKTFWDNENKWWGFADFYYATGDKYMGCRFKISDAWHYGWVRLDVGVHGITIKDYAYHATANAGIETGQTSTGLEPDNELEGMDIWPTPAKDVIHLSYLKAISKVDIYDLSGACVMSKVFENGQPELNVSDLKEGMYILKIHTPDGLSVHRIVKE